jgi:glycerate kinase
VARVRGEIVRASSPCIIASDVHAPLFGPTGAAAVYGPQKGLAPHDVPGFEAEARRMLTLLGEHLGFDAALCEAPGAGAAGGLAFGLMAGVGARRVSGFDLVADWLDLDGRLARADLVLTGEGCFDASSLAGKGPGALRERARRAGTCCVVFAGSVKAVDAEPDPNQPLIAITPAHAPLARALGEASLNLARAIERWLEQRQ